jgi:hypothetical protein
VIVMVVRTAREGPARKRAQFGIRNLQGQAWKLTCSRFLAFSFGGLREFRGVWGGRSAGIPSGRAVAKIVCISLLGLRTGVVYVTL